MLCMNISVLDGYICGATDCAICGFMCVRECMCVCVIRQTVIRAGAVGNIDIMNA